jgi:hypothetical protein
VMQRLGASEGGCRRVAAPSATRRGFAFRDELTSNLM